ncbi:MAG: methionine gamma-lyase family protein [Lachnospiraceae bacterium]|nr:methionine gamma-lyase family protein [Lachnospiraceae bacterium]
MYEKMGVSNDVYDYGEMIIEQIKDRFEIIDHIAEFNQMKILKAFHDNQVSDAHFNQTTGYGYDDIGRDTLEKVYASVFNTEAALVRPQIASGTNALAIVLFGILRPGDEVLSISGKPYDTLEQVIGIRQSPGSLAEFGINYVQADLFSDGSFDYDEIRDCINDKTKMIMIQRSKGYETRPSFSVRIIAEAIKFVKEIKPDVIVMVDNCYGEFVDAIEPTDVGADIMVGSLIKNPGGGLCDAGGYIVGRKDLVELCSYRMTAPGVGAEIGANFGVMKSFFQGLFMAPSVVASALKGAIFAANIYEKLGFKCVPNADEDRNDIIQAIEFGTEKGVVAFCKGIQAAAPVDSFVVPEGAPMPGYEHNVIMAAGTFVQGSSIELSADGPLTEPYAVYFQGGLTWAHAKLGILRSLQEVNDNGVEPVKMENDYKVYSAIDEEEVMAAAEERIEAEFAEEEEAESDTEEVEADDDDTTAGAEEHDYASADDLTDVDNQDDEEK